MLHRPIDPPLSMGSPSSLGPSSASQNSIHYIGMLDELMATGMDRQDMLDEFINTLHEDFLKALHSVFREAVNARGANKQHWLNAFWLMVLMFVAAPRRI